MNDQTIVFELSQEDHKLLCVLFDQFTQLPKAMARKFLDLEDRVKALRASNGDAHHDDSASAERPGA